MQTANPPLEKLQTVNQSLREALDQVDEGVVIVGGDPLEGGGPKIYFANRKAAELTGYSKEEIVGEQLGLLYDSEKFADLLEKFPMVAEQNRTFETEKRLQCADGEFKVCRWTISGESDWEGRPSSFTLTFRELPEVDEDFCAPVIEESGGAVLSRYLEKSRSESMAVLAGGMAHDFNNILTSILANLSLARLGTSVSDEIRGNIEHAIEGAESGQALTQLLLRFAKGGSHDKKEIDLEPLIKRTARLAAMGSNVRCDFNMASDLWTVKVDETQIMQVFHNLMINARQSMPNGGSITLTCDNVRLSENSGTKLEPGYYVVTTVRDRGYGISEENLEKIFDPYFTTKTDGSGLGLATCFMAVELHGGTITVRSKIDVGTEFKVYLPAFGASLGQDTTREIGEIFHGDATVLVVDDQEGIRTAAVEILRRLGYEALPALDGEEAVQLYSHRLHSDRPISAVIMDMTLPGGMSGDDAMEELRRMDPMVRTIATSGYFGEEERSWLFNRGYVGVLPKPYTAESLSTALNAVLSS